MCIRYINNSTEPDLGVSHCDVQVFSSLKFTRNYSVGWPPLTQRRILSWNRMIATSVSAHRKTRNVTRKKAVAISQTIKKKELISFANNRRRTAPNRLIATCWR